jgi:hypothetical protein
MHKKQILLTLTLLPFLTSTTIPGGQDFKYQSEAEYIDRHFLGKSQLPTKLPSIQTTETNYFDTKFLSDTQAVETALEHDGFKETEITTEDHLKISTLLLEQTTNPEATILSVPGFVPGRRTGMATLYGMLKKKGSYNYMFIDTRGHGKSEGSPLSHNIIKSFEGIKKYGESEYLDVAACIEKLAENNKQKGTTSPIIIHGICAGAHNSIKALIHLQETNSEAYAAVGGIIFDSGWSRIPDIAETVINAETHRMCKKIPIICHLEKIFALILIATYRTYFKESHEKQVSITNMMKKINIPTLFIHAKNDRHVPIKNTQAMIEQYTKPADWTFPLRWDVEDGGHALNHLKQKDLYEDHLFNFIKNVKNRRKN